MSSLATVYRSALRAARKFPAYNTRQYFVSYVNDEYRAASSASAQAKEAQIAKWKADMEMMNRQATIQKFYYDNTPLAVEVNPEEKKK